MLRAGLSTSRKSCKIRSEREVDMRLRRDLDLSESTSLSSRERRGICRGDAQGVVTAELLEDMLERGSTLPQSAWKLRVPTHS